MTHLTKWLFAPALFLALASAAPAEGLKRITDEATFRTMIVGKKLTGQNVSGTVTVKKNGQLSGRFDGQRLKGAWNWQKGLFCRTVQLGKNDARSACQKIHASGDRVRFTTTDGNRVTEYSY